MDLTSAAILLEVPNTVPSTAYSMAQSGTAVTVQANGIVLEEISA
jgi:hypothetical protein